MGRIYEKLKGRLDVEVFGAYVEGLLNAAALSAIALWDVRCVDDCTVRLRMYETDYPALEALSEKCMCELKPIGLSGGSRDRKLLRRRVWLLVFLLLMGLLLFVSSLFIWEIEVVGNEQLTDGQVLRALSRCGVDSGTCRYSVSADLVRSQMLRELPELAWMTVNISGSRAVAVVMERQEKPEIYAESAPADIVAARTGIVRRLSVENGRPVVHGGQSVLAGETLVSAEMDSLSNGSKYVRARAQVLADTWRELSAVCSAREEVKQPNLISRSRFAVIFGKRRINLYFDSGKAIDECDKIIHEYNLGAEGLFALPVTLVREELRAYDTQLQPACDRQEMERQLNRLLLADVKGQVLEKSFTAAGGETLYVLTLRCHCLEDIARVVGF